MDLVETMTAVAEPDVYGGVNFDELIPRWHLWAEGDKDSEYSHEPLKLFPSTFPPGTKISISEPLCPNCEQHREPKTTDPLTYEGPCHCGFDWDGWVQDEYS